MIEVENLQPTKLIRDKISQLNINKSSLRGVSFEYKENTLYFKYIYVLRRDQKMNRYDTDLKSNDREEMDDDNNTVRYDASGPIHLFKKSRIEDTLDKVDFKTKKLLATYYSIVDVQSAMDCYKLTQGRVHSLLLEMLNMDAHEKIFAVKENNIYGYYIGSDDYYPDNKGENI